jgi:hypothetical protein
MVKNLHCIDRWFRSLEHVKLTLPLRTLQTHVRDSARSYPQHQYPPRDFGNSIDNSVLFPIETNPIQVVMAAQWDGTGRKRIFGEILDTLNSLRSNIVIQSVQFV